LGGDTISAGGVVLYGGTAAAGVAAIAAGSATGMATAGAAAAGVVLIAPALIVGGIVNGMNKSEVNKRIESRKTLLPAVLPPSQGRYLDLFFPVTPSPQKIEIVYFESLHEYTLYIDTREILNGLHLGPANN
jgi:hypothetical protein